MRAAGIPALVFLLRKVVPHVFVCFGLWGVVFGPPPASGRDTTHDSVRGDQYPTIHVRAIVVVTSPTPTAVVATIQAEAERIWDVYGVRIDWLSPGPPLDSSVNVVVHLAMDQRRCSQSRTSRERTLGCFQTDQEGDSPPVIMIFPERAHRLVCAWAVRISRRWPDGWLERRAARLAGRALAHELGHYLLGSGHSASGLMRAELGPEELAFRSRDGPTLTVLQSHRLSFSMGAWSAGGHGGRRH
jgi:hypothetical protein